MFSNQMFLALDLLCYISLPIRNLVLNKEFKFPKLLIFKWYRNGSNKHEKLSIMIVGSHKLSKSHYNFKSIRDLYFEM